MNKKWYQSKTMWGLMLTAFMAIIQMLQGFGVVVPEELVGWMTESFVNSATSVGEVIGIVFAMYGRSKATGGLTL